MKVPYSAHQFLFSTAFAILSLAASVVLAAPANDLFVNRTTIAGTNITVSGSNVGASLETGEPQDYYSPGGASVWWSWTPPFSGFVTITTSGSSIDTILGIFTGNSVSALTPVAFNDDESYPDISTSKILVDVKEGQTYQISVDGYSGAAGNVLLQVQLEPFPIAPSWSLLDPYGVMIYSSNYAGKVVVFDFWATWCGPCKAEMPDFVSLQEQYRADGLVIVGAACGGDTPVVVQNFMVTFSPTLNYQIVMSSIAVEAAFGGIQYIPATFIIDRQNRIRRQYVGTQTRSTFESSIVELLYENVAGPPLTYQQTSSTLMFIRWPTNSVTYTLEWAADLANPTWTTWSTPPTLSNGSNRVQVAISGKSRFFRLKRSF